MIQPESTPKLPPLSLLPPRSPEDSSGEGAPALNVADMLTAVEKLYRSMPVVRMILDHAAGRLRNQVATRVDRMLGILLENGPPILREELMAAFGALEKISVGRIVEGRTPTETRFVWHVGLMDLGRQVVAAHGVPQPKAFSPDNSRRKGLLTHIFHLRADLPVTFQLPADLSPAEVARLSAFLKTLPLIGHDGA